MRYAKSRSSNTSRFTATKPLSGRARSSASARRVAGELTADLVVVRHVMAKQGSLVGNWGGQGWGSLGARRGVKADGPCLAQLLRGKATSLILSSRARHKSCAKRCRTSSCGFSYESKKIYINQRNLYRFHVDIKKYAIVQWLCFGDRPTVCTRLTVRRYRSTSMMSNPFHKGEGASEGGGTVLRVSRSAQKLGISRQLLYRKLNTQDPLFDPDFPKPIKLSVRATGFLEGDLDEWLRRRRS